MKTESAQFASDRLNRFGMQPVLLLLFPDDGNKAYSTISASVSGAQTYLPYLLSVGRITFSIDPDGWVGRQSSCTVTLARNADTDSFLTAIKYGNRAQLNLAFYKNAPIPAADLMPVARFIIGDSIEVTQATLSIQLLADERKLVNVPKKALNETAGVPEAHRNAPAPYILGDFSYIPSIEVANCQFYEAKAANYLPCNLADELFTGGPSGVPRVGQWLIADNAIGTGMDVTVTSPRVFEYNSTLDAFLRVANTSTVSPFPETPTYDFANVSGESYIPSAFISRLRCSADRTFYRLCESEYVTRNQLNDSVVGTNYSWFSVANSVETDFARVQIGATPARARLSVGFKNHEISFIPTGIFAYFRVQGANRNGADLVLTLREGWVADNTVSAGTTTTIAAATPTLPYVEVRGPLTTFGSGHTLTELGSDFSKVFLEIEATSGAAGAWADISFLGLIIAYTDTAHTFKNRKYTTAGYEGYFMDKRGRSDVRQVERPITKVDIAASSDKTICAEVIGTRSIATVPGNTAGFDMVRSAGQIYGFLTDILGYTGSEIDTNNFIDFQAHLLPASVRKSALFVESQRAAVDVLNDLCSGAYAVLWFSGDGRWKIHGKYYQASDPITAFTDITVDYIIENLTWEKLEPVFNKFKINYQYDYIRKKFSQSLTQDNSAGFPGGRPAPDFDIYAVRDSVSAANLQTDINGQISVMRRIVSFETSLAASALEVGDWINVHHSALITDAVQFRIIEWWLEPSNMKIGIRAIGAG